MASGYGLMGGRSRCFPMWQEVHKCYAMSDDPKSCSLQLDDYFECLHHNKEIARAESIKREEIKQLEARKKREAEAKKKGDTSKNEVLKLDLVQPDTSKDSTKG